MNVADLVDAACSRVRSDDFGADTWQEGLQILVDSLNTESFLNELGRTVITDQLVGHLANRLEVESCYRTYPEIEEEEIVAPLFGLGLPRTGSTALSFLLAADTSRRSLRSWEAAKPCPPPRTATEHTDARIAQAQAGIDLTNQMFPDFVGMLPSSATGPQECLLVMALDFRSNVFEGMARVPSYSSWLLSCDMEPAYRYHRRVLKLLQWRCPPNRWWLKTPAHMQSIGALDAVYPDARFVMTHRDVGSVLPSVCAVMEALSGVLTERRDPIALGRHNVEVWRESLRRLIAFRDDGREGRFHDISFSEMRSDPLPPIERLYYELGDDLSIEARDAMRRWWTENAAARQSRRRYPTALFGLDQRDLREQFAFYHRRFGIEAEERSSDTDPAVRASYERYLSTIDAARTTVQGSPFMRNDADRAAGERFLRGITSYALAAGLNLSTDQPLMQLLPDPSERLGFNNPDNLYYVARVSDRESYSITGTRGTSTGFLIQAFADGLPGNGDDAGATTAFLGDSDLHIAADGSFSLTLSAQRPAEGDWMPLLPGTDNLLVRFSFLDWDHEEPGSISIARIGEESDRQIEITPALAAAMLDDAASTIRLQARFYVDQAILLTALGPNFLLGPREAQGQQGTNVQQWNLVGNYDLTDDQALIITIKDVPQAQYANLVAATPWFDTFEFIHHQTSLNRAQVRVDGDGYIRYVVSARDPGVPNWIETTGQAHGVLFGRWQEVEGELGSDYVPTLTILALGDLRGSLPSDTPTVTPEERTSRLARRQQLIETRLRNADPAEPEILRRLHEIERLLGQSIATL